jgi:cell division protein FtsQ
MRFLARQAQQPAAALRQAAVPPRRARRSTRRRLKVAVVMVSVAALGGGGFWSQRSGVAATALRIADDEAARIGAHIGLAVTSVEVEGRHEASPEAILAALGVERGSPILALDPAAAKARLEALPWIRAAAVERHFPDTIRVRLVERQPVAFWQRHNKLVLVDRDGVELATDHLDSYGSLLVLVGDDAPTQAGALHELLATEPALASRVEAAVRVGARRWNLRLVGGVEIELPELDPIAAWHRLADADRSDHLLERNILTVDLRLPDRLGISVVPEPRKETVVKKGRSGAKST